MGSRCFKRLISSVFALTLSTSAALAACAEDQVAVRGEFGQAQFGIELADTIAERSRGLMFVEQMGPMEGMLFAYDRASAVSFWMRNTLIPLDMIFADETGVVQNIHAMAQPLDETPIYGGDNIQFVLEINGGMAGRLGLNVGDQLQHPSIGEDAIWPCAVN